MEDSARQVEDAPKRWPSLVPPPLERLDQSGSRRRSRRRCRRCRREPRSRASTNDSGHHRSDRMRRMTASRRVSRNRRSTDGNARRELISGFSGNVAHASHDAPSPRKGTIPHGFASWRELKAHVETYSAQEMEDISAVCQRVSESCRSAIPATRKSSSKTSRRRLPTKSLRSSEVCSVHPRPPTHLREVDLLPLGG